MKYILYSFIVFSFVLCGRTAFAVELDSDKDGLLDSTEKEYQTDPMKPDTDGDGYIDGWEVAHGYSPLIYGQKKLTELDTDSDGLKDALEVALGTDQKNNDTDDDGVYDGEEVYGGNDPLGKEESVRKVVVDLSTQSMEVYLNDVKIETMPVSTGRRLTPTPTGEFTILRKVPVIHYFGVDYDYPNTKWNLEFKKTFYLHGTYWHNKFGVRPMSHGCVNISYPNAEKLYKFLKEGDSVIIVGVAPVSIAKK